MNKEQQKTYENFKKNLLATFKEHFPEAVIYFPNEITETLEKLPEQVAEPEIITEEAEAEVEPEVIIEEPEPEPEPEHPTLQEELEEIVVEANEVETIEAPENPAVVDFLSNLLENDEEKLIELLRKINNK